MGRFISFFSMFLATFSMVACTTTNLESTALEKGDGKALLIFKVEGVSSGYPGVNVIDFNMFDENRATEKPNQPPTKTGIGVFKTVDFKSMQDGYVFTKINPGKYYIPHFAIQTRWGGCLNSKTIKFDIEPDEITYLGKVNFDPLFKEVSARIQEAGDAKVGVGAGQVGVSVFYGDLENELDFKQTNIGLVEVENFLKSSGMTFDVPVVAPDTETISFSRGGDGNIIRDGLGCGDLLF